MLSLKTNPAHFVTPSVSPTSINVPSEKRECTQVPCVGFAAILVLCTLCKSSVPPKKYSVAFQLPDDAPASGVQVVASSSNTLSRKSTRSGLFVHPVDGCVPPVRPTTAQPACIFLPKFL